MFNRKFFYESTNSLVTWLPELEHLQNTLRVIAVSDFAPGQKLELIMDFEAGRSAAFLKPEDQEA